MNCHYTIDLSSEKSPQTRWLKRLDSITMPGELGKLVVDYVEGYAECLEAKVLWEPGDVNEPADEDGWARNTWLHDVAVSGVPQYAPTRREVAFRLCDKPRATLLLLVLQADCEAEPFIAALLPMLQLAGRRLRTLLTWVDQECSRIQLERSERLHRALFKISDLASSDSELPEILRHIHTAVQTLVHADNFFIVLYNEQRASIRYIYHVDVVDTDYPSEGEEIFLRSIEHSLTWYLVTQGKAMMGSIAEMRDQVSGPLVAIGSDCADWLGVPMMRDGQVRAAAVVQSYESDEGYSEEDMAMLKFVSNHILSALERKQAKGELEHQVVVRTLELAEANRGLCRQMEELEHAERLQEALYQIAKLATANIEEDEFYKTVHNVVGQFLNARNFFVALIADCRQRLDFPYIVDETGNQRCSEPIGRTLSEHLLRQGQPMMGDRATIQALVDAGEIDPWTARPMPASWLGAPLTTDGQAIGLLVVKDYDNEASYTESDRDLLGFVALQIACSLDRRQWAKSLQRRVEDRTRALRAEIVEREKIERQLSHQVMHDLLTGLPNRRYLRDRIVRMQGAVQRAHQRQYALLYLDVDRFKTINDSLGHLAGDEILRAVANHLSSCIRHPDLAARLSGDEFAVLLETVDTPAAAMQVAQRIMDRFDGSVEIAGKDLQVSVSLGIVVCDVRYQTVDQVLHDADVALYRAKKLGRRRFELFDEAMAKDAIDVLAMEAELRTALREKEFEPYFQPIRCLTDGRVVGYEALIRWNHSTRGVLEPEHFLKTATDCKLIETIDWQMFELSFRSFAQHAHDKTFVTFNVSALHLGYEDFDTRLIALLECCGLAPERVVMEVTEEVLLDNSEAVRVMLTRLRSIGVGAALDDFGTGYSSLHYLHNLPLCMLKIDRAFVSELDKPGETNSSTVVAAILALALALDIKVIAEGIETQSQRNTLIAMGCQLGQGYLLGRPHPVSNGVLLERADEMDGTIEVESKFEVAAKRKNGWA